MTIEEAIEYFSKGTFVDFGSETQERAQEARDMALSALRAQQEAEKNEPLTNDLLKISGLMLSYAEDCDWGDDVCKDCHFCFFCEEGFNPIRIADTIQQTAALLGKANHNLPKEAPNA